MLIFSGDSFGQIMKWERLQSNHFMYRSATQPLLLKLDLDPDGILSEINVTFDPICLLMSD